MCVDTSLLLSFSWDILALLKNVPRHNEELPLSST